VQTDVPVVQAMVPVRQTWSDPLKVQALPDVHPTQVPLLHTAFVPQAVPLASGCCVSEQVATPSEQMVWPT
jgi:hypothetical protein